MLFRSMKEFFYSQPTHVPSYKQLRRHYEGEEDWEELFDLEMIITPAYPENGFAFYFPALAAYRAGDPDKIIDAYLKAAEYGFFDMDYALKMMSADERREFEQNARYPGLIDIFEANHQAAIPERREMALNRPLDKKIRNFVASDLRGRTVNLNQYLGKIVVLDFWSSFEPNHKRMLPRLHELRLKYPEIELISVSVMERYSSEDLLRQVADKSEKQGMDWTVWVGDEELTQRMRVRRLPTLAVVDADGYARYRIQGYHPYIDEILGYMIDAAMLPRLEDQANTQ